MVTDDFLLSRVHLLFGDGTRKFLRNKCNINFYAQLHANWKRILVTFSFNVFSWKCSNFFQWTFADLKIFKNCCGLKFFRIYFDVRQTLNINWLQNEILTNCRVNLVIFKLFISEFFLPLRLFWFYIQPFLLSIVASSMTNHFYCSGRMTWAFFVLPLYYSFTSITVI